MAGRSDRTLRRPAAGQQDLTLRRPEQTLPQKAEPPEGVPPSFTAVLDGMRRQLTVSEALASGGEGSLYLARAEGQPHVVKVLTYDADAQVIDALYRNSPQIQPSHLMPIEYVGSMGDLEGQHFDARQYLVLPYYPDGDLSSLENLRRINPSITFDGTDFTGSNADYAAVKSDYAALDVQAFTELTSQLHEAVKTLHTSAFIEGSGGIVHRDIRPQNIMLDKDRYVLGDYGLVSVLTQGLEMKLTRRFGLSHGYSPPEAYAGGHIRQSVSRKYDYFSLGMTLLHAAGGRPRYLLHAGGGPLMPYETLLDDFYETIALSNVQIPEELPARVRLLLRGLLLAQPEYRWGAQEVEEWLAGEEPAVYTDFLEQDSGISIKFDRRVHKGEAEIVDVILANWDTFRDLTAQGDLEFKWTDPDLAVKRRVDAALARSRFMNPELGLREVVRAVDPSAGHIFFGKRYASDRELGEAMASEEAADTDLLAQYLAQGGLSALRRSGAADDAQLETVEMLEAYARIRPKEAVRLTGMLLLGTALPPLTMQLSTGETLSFSLDSLTEMLRAEFAAALQMYMVKTAGGLPPLSPVPGCYGAEHEPCIVQYDGSIIAPMPPGTGSFPVPDRLKDLAVWISGGRQAGSVASLDPLLFLHMYEAGWIRGDNRARENMVTAAADGKMEMTVPDICALLGIFPCFREKHGLDEISLAFFAHIRRLLDRTAGICLPRSGAKAVKINANRMAAKDAIRNFEETGEWNDLVHAYSVCTGALSEISALAPANHAAAAAAVRAFEEIFSLPDGILRDKYDKTVHEAAGALDDPERLEKFRASMEELLTQAQQAQKMNLHRYALSAELEFLRQVSQHTDNRAPFLVPDTTDADIFFGHVRTWIRNYTGRSGGQE